MAEYEIKCVTKDTGASSWEHITHIGGPALGEITREDAVRRIGPSGTDKMFTMVGTSKAYLRVGTSSSGTKFVATTSDQSHANNLWNVPSCTP